MAKHKPLVKSEYETLAAFRYALRQFLHFSGAAAQSAGITAQQHQALLAVKGFPGRDQRHGGRVGGTIAASSPQRGWAGGPVGGGETGRSRASAEDRRRVLIQLTRRGEKILEKLACLHRQQLKQIGPEICQLLERLGRTEE